MLYILIMREHIEQQRDDFDSWCDKWDKAQEDGVFDDAPSHFSPSKQTAQTSFFGAVDADPTPAGSDVDKVDARYWNQVYSMSDHQGMAPDPLDAADDRLLQEDKLEDLSTALSHTAPESLASGL
jgi:hypothetical protein